MTSSNPRGQQRSDSSQAQRPGLRSAPRTPGPPLGPAPASQPQRLPSVRKTSTGVQKVEKTVFANSSSASGSVSVFLMFLRMSDARPEEHIQQNIIHQTDGV